MRRVDGLLIDYQTGEADVRFSSEFLGQSPEFQAIAHSYWIAGLLNERDQIYKRLDAAKRAALRRNMDIVTLDELLESGHSLLKLFPAHPATKKRLLFTLTGVLGYSTQPPKDTQPGNHLHCWESSGPSGFVSLCRAGRWDSGQLNSIKSIRRTINRAAERWAALQSLVAESSGLRVGEKSYRHFVGDIAPYLFDKDEREVAAGSEK